MKQRIKQQISATTEYRQDPANPNVSYDEATTSALLHQAKSGQHWYPEKVRLAIQQ